MAVEQYAVDADVFRAVMRRHAAGVVIVTAPGDPPVGFTATSFTSVSLDPPLVSCCVSHAASVWPTIEQADAVAVHLLTAEQDEVARLFAARGVDRCAQVAWRRGPGGVPLLSDALAVLACRVVERIAIGDHAIVIAEAIHAEYDPESSREPLVYHAGRYRALAEVQCGAPGSR